MRESDMNQWQQYTMKLIELQNQRHEREIQRLLNAFTSLETSTESYFITSLPTSVSTSSLVNVNVAQQLTPIPTLLSPVINTVTSNTATNDQPELKLEELPRVKCDIPATTIQTKIECEEPGVLLRTQGTTVKDGKPISKSILEVIPASTIFSTPPRSQNKFKEFSFTCKAPEKPTIPTKDRNSSFETIIPKFLLSNNKENVAKSSFNFSSGNIIKDSFQLSSGVDIKTSNNSNVFKFNSNANQLLKTGQIDSFKSPSSVDFANKCEKKNFETNAAESFPNSTFNSPQIDLATISVDEGNAEILFVSRCKLYRFDKISKEYIERGFGDIKLLKNAVNDEYRVKMYRGNTSELCANFPLFETFKISMKRNMPTVYSWICKDYSEKEEGIAVWFSARFKDAVIAKDFSTALINAVIRISYSKQSNIASPQK